MFGKYDAYVVVGYIFIGIITFGHSAGNSKAEDHIFSSREEQQVIDGLASGLMWPLYWSWLIFE